MRDQYHQIVTEWLESEELPTEEQLQEIEAGYQEWIRETLKDLRNWDEIGSDSPEEEEDQDLYTDLDPDWEEYHSTGRLY